MRRSTAGIVGIAVVAALAIGAWWVWGNRGGSAATLPVPLPTFAVTRQTTEQAVEGYVKAWQEGRFADMHALFTPDAQAKTPLDAFVNRMKAIHEEATIQKVTGTVGDTAIRATGDDPQGKVHEQTKVTLKVATGAVGEFTEDLVINTDKDDAGDWKIAWTPDALFHDLAGDRLIHLFSETLKRGVIVDRQGKPLANEAGLVTVGVVPAWIDDRPQTIALLSQRLDMAPDAIAKRIDSVQPEWYVQLKDLPGNRRNEIAEAFQSTAGVVVRDKTMRGYPNGALAENVVGYVARVSEEDLATLAPKGYTEDDLVGHAGVEGWGEDLLRGKADARLAIITSDGQLVRNIKEQAGQPARNIALALDANVQQIAEDALGGMTGSIVVMDPQDNSLLALATSPRIDPNGYLRGWSDAEWAQLNNDPRHPFQNRPAMSAYATGSVFKVITMAAGLERGGYRPNSRFECPGAWTGLPGVVLHNWILEGQGPMDFSTGLATSCDPVFYDVAKKLDGIDPNILPQFARAFGLGAPTGVIGIEENPGIVPDNEWKKKALGEGWYSGDSVNLGIGQGYLESTPLQVANAYATIARGGSLKSPLLVWRELDSQGNVVKEYKAEDKGQLPVSAANLDAIRAAMHRVAQSPEGTAYGVFAGFPLSVAAKSGTAENQDVKNTHAWFAVYGPTTNARVLVLVMLEGGGMGSANAAPIARRVLDATLRR